MIRLTEKSSSGQNFHKMRGDHHRRSSGKQVFPLDFPAVGRECAAAGLSTAGLRRVAAAVGLMFQFRRNNSCNNILQCNNTLEFVYIVSRPGHYRSIITMSTMETGAPARPQDRSDTPVPISK